MKLIQITELSSSLVKIISKDMPFSLSYKFNKLISLVDANEQFYNTKVRELLDQYAQKDENDDFVQKDGNILLIPETQMEFHEKHAALKDVEVSDKLPTFKLAELECLSISPQDLYPLMPLIEDEVE